MHAQRRRNSLKLFGLVIGLFALSCSSSTGSGGIGAVSCGIGTEAPSDALVFRNFTLIDGGDHAPVPQAAMVVEDGRVSWVGSEKDLKAP